MGKLTRDDVLKLATLARLKLSDEEVEQFRDEIDAILQYVEQLQTVKLDDLEPTSQVTGLTNVMRPDVVQDYGYSREELLKNSQLADDGHIKVKRIMK